MIPGNRLSSQAMPSAFLGGRALSITRAVDYELGPIAVQDVTQGARARIWRCRIVGRDVLLDADGIEPVTIYSAFDLTEISFTFDQVGRPQLAFVAGGQAFLRWFDPVPGQTVVTPLASDVETPRLTLDDKTPGGLSSSDVLLFYRRAGALYYRQQSDRFQVEIDPTEAMAEPARTAMRAQLARLGGLTKVGMGAGRRVQIQVRR